MNDELQDRLRARDDANRDYFLTLAYGRFSLDGLPGMAFVSALLLGVDVIPLASMVVFHGEQTLEPWFLAHLILVGTSLLLCLLGAAKSWVFRFQVLSTSVMACLAATGWVYALGFMMLSIASTVEDPAGGAMFSVPLLATLGAGGTAYVIIALTVHVVLLRGRLRDGHSGERMLGNLGVRMRAKGMKLSLLVLGAAFVVANVVTSGGCFVLISGSVGFLFLAAVTPSLLVELVYLVYLKSRDREYWEGASASRIATGRDVAAIAKRIGKWLLIAVGIFAVLVVLTMLSR